MLEAIQGFYEFNPWACTFMVLGFTALIAVCVVYFAGILESTLEALIDALKEK